MLLGQMSILQVSMKHEHALQMFPCSFVHTHAILIMMHVALPTSRHMGWWEDVLEHIQDTIQAPGT